MDPAGPDDGSPKGRKRNTRPARSRDSGSENDPVNPKSESDDKNSVDSHTTRGKLRKKEVSKKKKKTTEEWLETLANGMESLKQSINGLTIKGDEMKESLVNIEKTTKENYTEVTQKLEAILAHKTI